MAVRWGILGCADIAKKVCVAIGDASNAQVVAIASREKARAEAYAAENCPGVRCYGSYDDLLNDDAVQVVYVPLPTGTRCEWVVKAAAKKKHVLCEKPIASTMEETYRMIDACKQAGVQFMDDTMFMHHDRMEAIRKTIEEGVLGKVTHVVSAFSIPFALDASWLAGNVRTSLATEPFGCLGDLGWYNVRFSLWTFGYEDPEAVSCHYLETTAEGVPLRATATLRFSQGRSATFDCSFKHAWRDWAEIVGEQCHLRVEDFVIDSKADRASFTVLKGGCGDRALTCPVEVVKTEEVVGCAQHTRVIEALSSIAIAGKLDDLWPTRSLQTQNVLDRLMVSAKQNGAWVPVEGSK